MKETAGCVSGRSGSPRGCPENIQEGEKDMKTVMTCMRQGGKYTAGAVIEADKNPKTKEMRLICVHPQIHCQMIHGFGGAFTDAAGYVYAQMDQDSRADFIRTYFDPREMHYIWGRTSIDSCDFSTEMYAADDDPDDEQLARMDYTRGEKYVLPLLRDAEKAAGQPIHMMLTPWSPPAWMKTNGSRVHGGFLREECQALWAEYICRYVKHCMETGMDVRLLSTQNEPQAAQTWDSCLFSGEQERRFISGYLMPAMQKYGIDRHAALLIWDHNKEKVLDRAWETMGDEKMKEMVGGIAFHWYSGDHFENLELAGRQFPGKRLVFSEGCVEHSIWGTDAELTGAIHYAHEYIGDLNAGADTFIDWNLLLDEKGGPNHVGNFCDAPMMYDTVHHKLQKKLSLDYIGHFSRYILPGAVRLGVSRYTGELEAAAAQNPDGTTVAVVLNPGREEKAFQLRIRDSFYPAVLPGGAIMTFVSDHRE